jgi:predicted amidohydrolase YtcJ
MRIGLIAGGALGSLILAAGCLADDGSGADESNLTAAGGPADLVLTNGVVFTMDPAHPKAEAVAVKGGRITFVGTASEAKARIGAQTNVEDLHGHVVLPSFFDSHTHLIWSATQLEDVDLSSATTVDALLAPIRARAKADPKAPWVRGIGWDIDVFAGKLDKAQLDGIVSDQNVYMESSDSHSAWVNSKALAAAGITAATADPAGGHIEKNAQGQPTGILREAATHLMAKVMPRYPDAQVDTGFAKHLAEANSFGITSIIDAKAEDWMLDGYQRFERQGKLTLRVRAAALIDPTLPIPTQVDAIKKMRTKYASDRVQVNAVKVFVDGVIETENAFLLKPYADGKNAKPNFTPEQLEEVATTFDKEGFQLHAHVIGDGAARMMLDAVEAATSANGARDRRSLLAHLQLVDPADIPRFKTLGAYSNFSALWAFPDDSITKSTIPNIGPERAELLYPIGAIQKTGAVVVGGSDWNVTSMNPFEAIQVAVTRQDPDTGKGPALAIQHKVTVQQILEAYTINGARASFVEKDLGSVTVGKLADLIVIERDPFAVDPHELARIKVLETRIEGKVAFAAPSH